MTGGFVATHILKEKDNYRRPGIVAEVNACYDLARIGKQVLRLPENIPTTRQLIKNARKADNVVFVISQEHHLETIGIAIDREFGNRLLKGGWEELPDVYCLRNNQLSTIWVKKK